MHTGRSRAPTRLRIALIGGGRIATTAHIPSLRSCRDATLVTIADSCIETANATARMAGGVQAFQDYTVMLREIRPDAVIICVPPAFHAQCTIAALESGAHVLCEKPPAMNALEAAEMECVAAQEKRLLTYGFQFRFSRAAEAVKNFIDTGELGTIHHTRAVWERRRGVPDWGSFRNPRLQGGGVLSDIGVHMIDLSLWLNKFAVPISAFAKTHPAPQTIPAIGNQGRAPSRLSLEYRADGLVRFSDGSSLSIAAAYQGANTPQAEVMKVTLFGERGSVDVFPPTVYHERDDVLLKTALGRDGSARARYHRQLAHFVDCCLGLAKPRSTAYQGVALQTLVDGLYESAAAGRSVPLSPQYSVIHERKEAQ